MEELLFRQCIQTDLLKNYTTTLIPKTIAESSIINNDKVKKVARIVLTSALFFLWHLQRLQHDPKGYSATYLYISIEIILWHCTGKEWTVVSTSCPFNI